jgi:sensor histidine kinase regulating citrate/malate metabolism
MATLRLQTRIILLVGATITMALMVTGLLVSWRIEARTRATLADKAAMVATLSADSETVVGALAGRRPRADAQAFADLARKTSGVDYIVVLDMAGTRLTHPKPSLIGDHFQGGDDAAVYRGATYTSVARGTLGTALRVFTPVRDAQGRQVGAVVVGVLMTGIDSHLWGVRRMILLGLALGFAAGVLGAVFVAGRIKRILMGMEPVEIASLLQRQTAILRSVREEILAEELSGVRVYADALRGQTHEFMNKLHVILGLVRLGEYDRLAGYLTDLTQQVEGEVGNVVRAIKDPVLAGFLLARASAAREQDLTMTLSEDSQVPVLTGPSLCHDAITILGNLLENAVEAMEQSSAEEIGVKLRAGEGSLVIQVEDRGPGLGGASLEHLCERGTSTKGADRGYGLHHVRKRVEALGGRLEAADREGGGARFTAVLPLQEGEDWP